MHGPGADVEVKKEGNKPGLSILQVPQQVKGEVSLKTTSLSADFFKVTVLTFQCSGWHQSHQFFSRVFLLHDNGILFGIGIYISRVSDQNGISLLYIML